MEIRNVGEMKELIKDLSDDLPIECSIHKLTGTYFIKSAYRCDNSVHEPILNFDIKIDSNLTERDEIAFKEWCMDEGLE